MVFAKLINLLTNLAGSAVILPVQIQTQTQ